ncbi:hypothetical protein CDSM653_02181 [Caldanaerobacter subterraneus subsp. pacificus DSM 12653]|uniref:Uncharacterized protein n=1 Tax=Caldanaerobacter subterraneus subsp. pacificus DSM 12653 TaxID=391606 RepID=A0A0F5PJK2_9THEO|nr:hypothetical protein CDSM653_02181 [Caldanaerobacter subterraneus subsp. pacificus DSM 12653]
MIVFTITTFIESLPLLVLVCIYVKLEEMRL